MPHINNWLSADTKFVNSGIILHMRFTKKPQKFYNFIDKKEHIHLHFFFKTDLEFISKAGLNVTKEVLEYVHVI